jgi:hypothetical protein
VVSNFRMKSQEMYWQDQSSGIGKYQYFNSVFSEISNLAVIKNFYDSNLYNIEEIFSILAIYKNISGSKESAEAKDLIANFIKDVIKHFTPALNMISLYDRQSTLVHN